MYLYLFYIGVPTAMGKPSVCSVSFMLDMQYAVMKFPSIYYYTCTYNFLLFINIQYVLVH
jgi:uncharacterized membrane protein YhdT